MEFSLYHGEPYVESVDDLLQRTEFADISVHNGRIKCKSRILEFPHDHEGSENQGIRIHVPDFAVSKGGEFIELDYIPFKNASDLVGVSFNPPIELFSKAKGTITYNISQEELSKLDVFDSLPKMSDLPEGATRVIAKDYHESLEKSLKESPHIPVIDYKRVCEENKPWIIKVDVDRHILNDLEVYLTELHDKEYVEISKDDTIGGTREYVMKPASVANHLHRAGVMIIDGCLHPSPTMAYFIPYNHEESVEYTSVPEIIKLIDKRKKIVTFTMGPGDMKIVPTK